MQEFNDNLKNLVGKTIFQDFTEITILDRIFKVAPPTIGTMILVSEEIGKMDKLDLKNETDNEIIFKTIANAENGVFLGRILAIMILGAKIIKKGHKKDIKSFFKPKNKTLDKLTEYIIDNTSADNLFIIFKEILSMQKIDFFFANMQFLNEVNLLKKPSN
ncbi:MAG: hypothetical protein LBV69_00060 [Bacteroidales bacterium]|jgi:hypothetical protein|nr:hypothetical protein [Bacteroidales bacterium]